MGVTVAWALLCWIGATATFGTSNLATQCAYACELVDHGKPCHSIPPTERALTQHRGDWRMGQSGTWVFTFDWQPLHHPTKHMNPTVEIYNDSDEAIKMTACAIKESSNIKDSLQRKEAPNGSTVHCQRALQFFIFLTCMFFWPAQKTGATVTSEKRERAQ